MTQQTAREAWTEKQRTAASKAREYALSYQFRLLDRVLTAFGAGAIIGFDRHDDLGLTLQVLLDSNPVPMFFAPFELQPEPTGKPLRSARS